MFLALIFAFISISVELCTATMTHALLFCRLSFSRVPSVLFFILALYFIAAIYSFFPCFQPLPGYLLPRKTSKTSRNFQASADRH